jgi:hypothetical protein
VRKALVLALLAASLPLSAARGALLAQDDAGSGRDAPNAADPTFRVDPGRVYDGLIEGVGTDPGDWYAVVAPAGASITASASGVFGCFRLYDSAGKEVDFGCPTGGTTATVSTIAETAGTYYVSYSYIQPDSYRFTVAVDTAAAPVATVEVEPLSSGGAIPRVRPATPRDDHVVVAVVDTGINPYHEFFRAPALTAHPSTWLPKFPKSAKPVRLSLGARDLAAAHEADAAVWDSMERTTYTEDGEEDHLYTFPGTRVIGAISFGEYADTTDPLAATEPRPVRDDHGHGTHSAGLALGANLPEADGNVLLVMIEASAGQFDTGVRWAAQQPWIDAISLSLGTRANAPLPAPTGSEPTAGTPWYTREAYANGKPVFIASGNGVSSTGVAPDKCTTYTSPYVGPVWATRIGAASPGGGSPTYWHCVPVEATARTNVTSPSHDSTRAGSTATWARLMLSARRAGVRVSRHRALEYLLKAASPPATQAGATDPSAYPASLADQGYGLVDARALNEATRLLVGGAGPTQRPETAEWFAQDRATRIRLWGPPPEPRTGT